MNIHPKKQTWLCLVFAAVLLTFGVLAIPWARWREQTVYQALAQGKTPAFWWPTGWREAFRTSFLLEGEVSIRDGDMPIEQRQSFPQARTDARIAVSGTIEFVSEYQSQVFRTLVKKGRYSFNPNRLPAGPFKVRLLLPDGSTRRWLQMPQLDPGLHRINWAF
jgi:hypothetical protein